MAISCPCKMKKQLIDPNAPPCIWWSDYLKSYDVKTKLDTPDTITDYKILLEQFEQSMRSAEATAEPTTDNIQKDK